PSTAASSPPVHHEDAKTRRIAKFLVAARRFAIDLTKSNLKRFVFLRVFASSWWLLFFCGLIGRSAAAQSKERADILVSGGTVVTMDSSRRIIDKGMVAVGGGGCLAVVLLGDWRGGFVGTWRASAA